MLGTQIIDNLRNFVVTERVAEGRHLVPAVKDLFRHLFRWPCLVIADFHERRGLLRAHSAGAVTVSATFIAKQQCASLGIGIGSRLNGERYKKPAKQHSGSQQKG